MGDKLQRLQKKLEEVLKQEEEAKSLLDNLEKSEGVPEKKLESARKDLRKKSSVVSKAKEQIKKYEAQLGVQDSEEHDNKLLESEDEEVHKQTNKKIYSTNIKLG